MSARALVAALGALALVACGGASDRPASTPATSSPDALAQFEQLEEEILRDLATLDLRMARRSRVALRDEDLGRVGMSAVLTEDPSIVLFDGRIDPFSFDARARGLAAVRAKLGRLPSALPAAAPGATVSPEQERGLLRALVDEESFRLDEERRMPRSASALVRAIVETWQPPASAAVAEERDRAIARRLREIRDSVAAAPPGPRDLDVLRARDLDDALDELEHLVDGPLFRASTAELVRLRQTLEERPSVNEPKPVSTWEDLAPRLTAHLGSKADADALERSLSAAEARARELASPALSAAGLTRDALSARLEPLLFPAGVCLDAIPGSRIRSMAASPEREPACHLRHTVARAEDDTARALAYAALHDHLVVALWALDVARGTKTLDRAARDHHLLAPPSSTLSARLERMALARPTAAIGAGYAAQILLEDEPFARARAWSQLGELPLDEAWSLLRAPRSP